MDHFRPLLGTRSDMFLHPYGNGELETAAILFLYTLTLLLLAGIPLVVIFQDSYCHGPLLAFLLPVLFLITCLPRPPHQ